MLQTPPSDMVDNAREVVRILKAISNENRLMILCLIDQDEMSVSELNDRVDLSQSALSQHLALLRKEGIVETRREAQSIKYRLANDKMSHLITTLHQLYCPDN